MVCYFVYRIYMYMLLAVPVKTLSRGIWWDGWERSAGKRYVCYQRSIVLIVWERTEVFIIKPKDMTADKHGGMKHIGWIPHEESYTGCICVWNVVFRILGEVKKWF